MTISPSLALNPEVLQTNGIRKNRAMIFTFTFVGQDVHDLLNLLEDSAKAETQDYLKLRAFVFAAETIREQAKEQGF